VDQAQDLARLLGMKAVFGKAMDFDGGGYGLAVLSKLPVASHQVHRLPGGGEPRIGLEVRVTHPAGEFSIVSVHLDHQDEDRRRLQAVELDRQLAARDLVVLCGDFNAVPDSPTMTVFTDWKLAGKAGPKMAQPAGEPQVEIDHVLLRGFEARDGVKVIDEQVASDHRPLVWAVQRAAAQGFPGIE
jgi:endonuclease/exonuclease/phosphatase family metal-dependent hydrolase